MQQRELERELAAQLGADHEARFIVDEVIGEKGSGEIGDVAVEQARALAARRAAGEPLQYVLGHWAFRSLDLVVDDRVLIPRPETEQVVEVALREIRALGAADTVVVDAGTGSGAIALALATELASSGGGEVFATDRSAAALEVARANLGLVGAAEGAMWPVTLLMGSWLEPLPERVRGTVSAVISNPPYVAEAEWPELDDDVRAEPRSALVADAASDGTPGLADVEAVLSASLAWLARPGVVVIELAPHQAEPAGALAQSLGYSAVVVHPDLAGRPRALVAQLI
jgi:release factor glutamine methyltransferase